MRISSNEFKIMELLWKENRPLSRADILKGTEGRNWNPASIHLILNSMISKGVIRITDEGKKYGRTYEACFSQEEYVNEMLQEVLPGKSGKELLTAVLDSFIYKDGKVIKRSIADIQEYLDGKSGEIRTKKKK